MLQYKEYMGQALYQERGAMPVRSFCLSGGYNPKLLVLETLLSGGQYPLLRQYPLSQYPEKTAHILKKVFLLHRPLVIDMKMFYY